MGGISLEHFRQRIGTFQPRGIKPKFLLKTISKFSHPYQIRTPESIKRKPSLFEVSSCATFYLLFFTVIYGSYHIGQNSPSFAIAVKIQDETLSKPFQYLNSRELSFSSCTNSRFYWISSKKRNKFCHSLEGNRRNLGYKYFAWNCDRGFFSENKLDDLKCYAYRSKTHIIGVSEINLVRDE